MGYFCIGFQILHSLISSTIIYLMIEYLPPKLAFKVVFVFALGYTVISHWYRLYVDYLGWTLDFTGIQMLLTIRLSSYGFDIYDGTLPVEKLALPELQKK